MLQWIVLDFETASATELKKSGAWRYSECPTTEIFCCGWVNQHGQKFMWMPGSSPNHPLYSLANDDSVTFIAHNVGFEKAIWRNIMVPIYGFPDIPDCRWHDTMAVCAVKVLPLDLDHACAVLRLPASKDREGSAFTKSLSKPNKKTGQLDRSPQSLLRVYNYNMSDLDCELGLHQRVGFLPAGERKVWLLDQRINERGVRLDLPYVRACQTVVDRAIPPLLKEFQEITGLKSVGQRDKIIAWCAERGLMLPNMRKDTLARLLGDTEDDDGEGESLAGEDADEGWDASSLDPAVRRALSIRQLIGSAAIKKLAAMEACVGTDGRARGLLQYHGAGTGRWAGRLLQPQNFPRGTVKIGKKPPAPDTLVSAIMTGDPEYVAMMIGPPVESVVSGLRHAIIADPGREIAAGDFSAIEACVVLALAGQHDKTKLIAEGKDIYCDLASLIYGFKVNKDDNPEERQFGKEGVLGCGFQMGWRKFRRRLNDKGIKATEDMAKAVVTTYREEFAPEVPKLWRGLENAAIDVVHRRKVTAEAFGVEYRLEDGWLTARLPSGRKLWYYNPKPCRRAMPWDETDIRLAWTYEAKKMGVWKTIDAYGGLLTENVVQALARDLMVSAMMGCEGDGFPVILTIHDEIVTEPEAWAADPLVLQQIMCYTPAWARALQIPVRAECWVGNRYKK